MSEQLEPKYPYLHLFHHSITGHSAKMSGSLHRSAVKQYNMLLIKRPDPPKIKELHERDNMDLLQLTLELYARSASQPNNRKMHEYAMQAKSELEKRLSKDVLLDAFAGGMEWQGRSESNKIVPFGSSPFNEWYNKYVKKSG